MSRRSHLRRPSLLDVPDWSVEMTHHSGIDLREAEYWGEVLRDKELQKDPATAERFYTELKLRLIRRFGTITQAFKEIDVAGDGTINFIEWNSMLLLMHLPLECRACRWIFGCASGGTKEVSLEELKVILLQPTLKKMKAFVRSYKRLQDRVNRHIQTFIVEIHESNHEIAVAAADRFQRRMKLPFCRQIYDKTVAIHSVAQQIQNKCIQDVTVDRATLGEMIANSVGSFGDGGLLLEGQVPMLMNIFARVGNNRGTSISLVDLMAALTILSTDVDRCGKLLLMFEVFDTDQDTVLEDHQLKDLFCLICKTRPLFESNPFLKQESGIAFQEELSEQEGLRNYECARWRLHRRGNNEDAVNWSELWAAIKDQPDVMTSLLPAPPTIHWALDPLPVHMQDLLPRAITPMQNHSSHGKRPVHYHSRATGHRPSSNSGTSRPTSRNSKVKVLASQGHTWKPQLTEFEKDLTERFRRRLRRLGLQRVTELKEGIDNPNARSSPRDGDTPGSVDVLSSSVAFQQRTSQLGTRTCSLPRLGSRGNSLKGITSGGQRSGQLSRVNTAPMGMRASVANSSSRSSATSSSRIDKLPLVDSLTFENALKWGVEAADRHRLLVAAQSIAEQENPDCGCHQGPDLSHMDTYPYSCHLCERTHALNPKPKHEDLQEY